MGSTNTKRQARLKRKKRIRRKILGTPERPRLSVFRSARHIYAQIIDDLDGRTLVTASSLEKDIQDNSELKAEKGKIAVADQVGKLVAERSKEKGITRVVFDRNGFIYHGRVKAVSDGAREAGLEF
ncbi:MAG: 50S ribosomal protein L18 [Thermodesulfobacteriota bacterium]